MFRRITTGIAASIFLLGAFSPSTAAVSDAAPVISITVLGADWPNLDERGQVRIKIGSMPADAPSYFVIPAYDLGMQMLLSAAELAQISNRNVRVEYDPADDVIMAIEVY